VLVSQQFIVKFDFEELISPRNPPIDPLTPSFHLETTTDDNTIQVFRVSQHGRRPFVQVDRVSGVLISFSPHGKDLLFEGIVPNFVRASTDNDKGGIEFLLDMMTPIRGLGDIYKGFRGMDKHSYDCHWKMVGLDVAQPLDTVCLRTRITDASTSERLGIVALCVVRSAKRETELFKIKLHYTIYSDGRVRVSKHVAPQSALHHTPSIARVGLSMQLDPSLYHVQYYGRGPFENYPDRKSGLEMGVYNTTSDVVCSNSCLRSRAKRERNGTEPVHVNIDLKLMGVGGDYR
jgi:beta-galactosidase/beta-glucuronidase